MFTTKSPWLRRTYIVRIVDLKVAIQGQGGPVPSTVGLASEPDSEIETGIFIQTAEKGFGGILYIPRQLPGSSSYRLECNEYDNLLDNNRFDSESPIGFIYKGDFRNKLPGILGSIPLPGATCEDASADPSPLDSTD
ncbi:hypothetical protein FZEAL_3036 [Fusarium zealandicum]|uniref:Uncharacterized protein n=1 Tax=Fusarium zealandicum TaxID=1053134 RepID=A0A8H4UPE8_9HYPO|nr:hypothetical protein FZEAL_3036 [Fusarium zealandicum]